MPHKQIAFFNHKGGVSKTTSVFHIGWMLASKGHRVVVVDCDPQCNLTGLVLSYTQSEEYPYEAKGKYLNIRDGLAPAFEARPVPLAAVELQSVDACPGLFVMPGHVGLAEYESQLSIAHELSSSLTALQNIPGSIRWLIDLTAASVDAEFVLVDMSPSLGALNQNLFATSDAFVIPMAPDFFSAMALRSLARVLPKWTAWSAKAAKQQALQESAYPWPDKTPKYIGSIVQNYRVRSQDGKEAAPTRAYQKWFDALLQVKSDVLMPSLTNADLTYENTKYEAAGAPVSKFLAEIPDFNSLIAISQSLSKPVFQLEGKDFGYSVNIAQNQLESAHKFRQTYSKASDKMVKILS